MKKVLSILCCIVLLFCVAACGKRAGASSGAVNRKHPGKQQYPDFYRTAETLLGYARAAFLCGDL